MRPTVKFLDDQLLEQIISEGRDLICNLGVEIHNDRAVALLSDHGARVDNEKGRVYFTPDLIDKAVSSASSSFRLYDSLGEEAAYLGDDQVNFTPGSAAIQILDN